MSNKNQAQKAEGLFSIDRIEGDWAVLERQGVELLLPCAQLPQEAKEGSCLIQRADGTFQLDKAATKQAQREGRARLAALLQRKKRQ